MTLIPVQKRWPTAEFGGLPSISTVREEMNRLIDGMFLRPLVAAPSLFTTGDGSAWIPMVDVAETDTEIRVRAELPGVAMEDVDVSVSGERLVISGEKKSASESKTDGWLHRESSYGAFSRTLTLPEAVDPDKVSATFEAGVLTVTLTKKPANKARKITVKANGPVPTK